MEGQLKKPKSEIRSWVQIFSHHIFNKHILPYLPIINYISLLHAVPIIRNKCPSVPLLLVKRLKIWMKHNNIPEYFIAYMCEKLMQSKNFSLSGSLLLLLLTENNPFTSWSSAPVGDIDIIYSSSTYLSDRLPINRFDAPPDCYYEDPTRLSLDIKESKLYQNSYLKKIEDIFFKNSNIKIQFLIVKYGNVKNYVKTFDLNFCCNLFTCGKLWIQNPIDIIKKQLQTPLSVRDKYFSKNISTPEYMFHTYLPAQYMRLRKYALRGFDFTLRDWKDRDYITSDEQSYLRREHNETIDELWFREGLLSGFWYMFWSNRIDSSGKLDINMIPHWKLK
jgi:hypothetical protein